MGKQCIRSIRSFALVLAAFCVSTANGAVVEVVLTDVVAEIAAGSPGATNPSSPDVSGSTAIWQYDTSTGILSASGLYQSAYSVGSNSLFTRDITDLTVGDAAASSATSFTCTEGVFGSIVEASLCGRYYFGDNGLDDSTWSYGPGTSSMLTLGGDDYSSGQPMQTLGMFDGMVGTLTGGTLVMTNLAIGTPSIEMTFQVVPVPAAVWLFGSALGLLGWARRRRA